MITLAHFPSYFTIVSNNIKQCRTEEQLVCCYNLIEHFKNLFTGKVLYSKLKEAEDQLLAEYAEKQSRI